MEEKKRRIFFRVFPGNRLTMPLLLNVWEQNGLDRHFTVRLLEAPLGRLAQRQVGKLEAGDVFVYSFMTPHLPWVAAEIKRLRSAGGVPLLLAAGGPQVSAEPELASACGFNVLFLGPGEETFVRFGRELLAGTVPDAGGIVYDGRAEMANAGTASAWERYVPVSAYFRTIPPLELIRGCFWNCAYCQTAGALPRCRGLDSVSVYLEELRRRGMGRVGFIAPSALEYGAAAKGSPDLGRIEALLQLCRRYGFRFIEYGIFPSEIRPDTASREGLKLLQRAATNRRLTFGAQSAKDGRLEDIGRGHRVEDVVEAVAMANEAGFIANLDFIIALPGETAADRCDLIELMRNLAKQYRVFFHVHYFFPLAGSAFARRLPAALSAGEKRAFFQLRRDGLANDWWLAGEKSVRGYFRWLGEKFPKFCGEYLH